MRLARGAAPQIVSEFVDTGKVRFVFRNFPFLGDESLAAAQASNCAAEQGQFWPYHDRLIAEWKGEGKGVFVAANLKRFASELGLNTMAFNTCLDSGKYAALVRTERDQGTQRGVRTTPTMFVGDVLVEGEREFQYYAGLINDQLSRAGQ